MRYFVLFVLLLIGCSSSTGETIEEIPRMASESAAEPAKPKVFLYVYTARWCGVCHRDRPRWEAWAKENGLAVTETNDGNYPIHVVDIDKVRTSRNIPLLPTYLILSESGEELWRHEGAVEIEGLDKQWRLENK